jgi:hypothetical protein
LSRAKRGKDIYSAAGCALCKDALSAAGKPFAREAEKPVFKFGGSASAAFGERRVWTSADDLLQH